MVVWIIPAIIIAGIHNFVIDAIKMLISAIVSFFSAEEKIEVRNEQ